MNPRQALLLTILAIAAAVAFADEGMWTYNNFPVDRVRKTYGFAPSPEWLDHLRLASVRFNNGGSGSFVSADGLVLTNHHVGSECIHELSTAQNNYMAQGFYAARRGDEKRCPNLELNVLMGVADVTSEVNAGTTKDMAAAVRLAHQRKNMAGLEKQCVDQTGLRCDVVTLYEGGVFNLYRYKKYTDVRLVFAPEEDIAAFGGDPDNFNFPRYCLDMAFFRVYEHDRPAKIEHYLRWSAAGPKEGEVGFVSGNPGSTSRQMTMAQLEFLRDTQYPFRLKVLEERLQQLYAFTKRGAEEARVARDVILSYENSLKAFRGEYDGLKDPTLMARRAESERKFRSKVAADPELQKQYGGAWDEIAKARASYAKFYHQHAGINGLAQSRLFQLAIYLVRLPAEKARPNGERLREYRDSNLPSVEQDLFSEAPIYASLETVLLGLGLAEAGRRQPAADLVAGTRLADVAFRKKLHEGGADAVAKSDDPLIRLVRSIDPEARALRKRFEDEIDGVERAAGSLLAKARFALEGTSVYPEATFTLRLSYGAIKGYMEKGKKIPFTTTYNGVYQRATGQPPFQLPPRWIEKKAALNLRAGFNFVLTADIIGGNSGSPVVDRKGELIGLIFDGNIQSLPNRFLYSEEQARSVAVHGLGIIEALKNVYGAQALVAELGR
jgi:hypothetical protein